MSHQQAVARPSEPTGSGYAPQPVRKRPVWQAKR